MAKDYEAEVRSGRLTVNAPKKLLARAQMLAQIQGISTNEFVVRMLEGVVNGNIELINKIEAERKTQAAQLNLFVAVTGSDGTKKTAE